MADLAEQAGVDDLLLRVDQVRRALALRADLHHALVLAGRGEHRLAFEHVDADRLLQIDVGAGLDGGDGVQRVPVVGRADEHDVEVLLLEHLAVVGVGRGGFWLRPLPGDLDRLGEHVLVRIAEGDDLDRRDLHEPPQVALAVPAGADQADAAGFLVDEFGPVGAERRTWRRWWRPMRRKRRRS